MSSPRPGPGPAAAAVESDLAARVLDALLREDYGGLRRLVRPGRPRTGPAKAGAAADVLALPNGRLVPLAPSRFLTDRRVAPGDRALRLDGDVFATVRAIADPRDDVESFERECRAALATALLHEEVRPVVLRRLGRMPDAARRGPGTFYETLAAFNDHPVHPAGRCRFGLGATDLARYAPEFAPAFAMRWAAVPRRDVTAAGVLPDWWPEAEDGDRDLFPVHPLTVPLLRDRPDVAVLPEPYLRVSPTLSMRTVAAGPLTHLKAPLPTSTLGRHNRRTIVPGTLPDGALAERLLRRVLDRAPGLPVLTADEQTYGHAGSPLLGYLVRRFPAETARAHVVPVAALLAEAPEGGCVMERWDVPELFAAYLDALLAWNVALFRHGIALEAHQQNVALVIGDGGPRTLRLLVKDNDGTLVDPDRVAATLGTSAPAFTDPRMATRDPDALARVFVTITLHLCAAAPAFGLAERGLLPLRAGLGMVRDRLDAALGPGDAFLRSRTLEAGALPGKAMLTAGTLVDKARTGAADINKHYGPPGPNYLRDDTCC